jgi:hypothetical protein
MLSVILLHFILLNVTMLDGIMLIVVMLSFTLQSDVRLNVIAPPHFQIDPSFKFQILIFFISIDRN